jgi:hypothetical protein
VPFALTRLSAAFHLTAENPEAASHALAGNLWARAAFAREPA